LTEGQRHQVFVRGTQVLLLVMLLLGWEYLPQIPELAASSKFLDPFFVSSPSRIAKRLGDLMTGTNGSPLIWNFVWPTVSAAMIGLVVGVVTGALAGLLLSSSKFLSDVIRPYLIAFNAIPRIALIPVIVILFGASQTASVVICWLVVFFVAFFNSYEGGRTVAPHLLQNAAVMGANRWDIMRHIRLPFCIAWTLAAVPLAATFSLLIVIGSEIITGTLGLGRILTVATASVDASLTFAIVVVMSVLGVAITTVIGFVQRRAMHWWGHG
jgi:NitT/TauT family transport system permease protein